MRFSGSTLDVQSAGNFDLSNIRADRSNIFFPLGSSLILSCGQKRIFKNYLPLGHTLGAETANKTAGAVIFKSVSPKFKTHRFLL